MSLGREQEREDKYGAMDNQLSGEKRFYKKHDLAAQSGNKRPFGEHADSLLRSIVSSIMLLTRFLLTPKQQQQLH